MRRKQVVVVVVVGGGGGGKRMETSRACSMRPVAIIDAVMM